MLFLESPPCVGFSIPKSYDCDTYTTDDNQTKYDNYKAIQSFLVKFPEYKDRDFYISGESYAGYVSCYKLLVFFFVGNRTLTDRLFIFM